MAHAMKMTKGACGHMFKHYERGKDDNGEYIKFGNQDIDIKRTSMNYNLAPHRDSQGAFVKQRCEEVYCLNRKDVNVACTWVVTLPKDYQEMNQGREEKEFFQATYDFLAKRYGQENVISAYVHMDENTPHMHYSFVPVVEDKKKDRLKVSAKECITKYDLKTFHKDLQEHLLQSRGLHANILNQATVEGNKSIEELKRGTATERLYELLSDVQKAQGRISVLEENKKSLESKIESLEGNLLSLEEVNNIKIKKPLLGGSKTVVNIAYEDAINLKKTASFVEDAKDLLKHVEQKTEELHKARENLAKERDEVKRIPLKEQMEKAKLIKENKEMYAELSALDKVMTKRPDLFQEIRKEVQIIQNTQSRSKGFEMER